MLTTLLRFKCFVSKFPVFHYMNSQHFLVMLYIVCHFSAVSTVCNNSFAGIYIFILINNVSSIIASKASPQLEKHKLCLHVRKDLFDTYVFSNIRDIL